MEEFIDKDWDKHAFTFRFSDQEEVGLPFRYKRVSCKSIFEIKLQII